MYNPPCPYLGPIEGGATPGKMIRINGNVPPNAQRFAVNLQCGPGVNPRDDIALHVNVRFAERVIVRNHLQAGGWGAEDTAGGLPIAPGQPCQILLLVAPDSYKIAINGTHFCEFGHRIALQRVSHLTIDGDITLSMIAFEDVYNEDQRGRTMGQPSPMGYNQMGTAPPMGMPPMAPPTYGEPQQYAPSHGYLPQNAALSYGGAPNMGYSQQPQAYGGGVPMMAQQRPKDSMGMKALKYGVPLAGVGLGAYALGGGFSGGDSPPDRPAVRDDPPEEPAADDDDWLGDD